MPEYDHAAPELLAEVSKRCLALPESWDEPAWAGHRFLIRKRNFAHVLGVIDDDGTSRTVMSFRSPDEERDFLLASGSPFFRLGWGHDTIGMVLDADTDWDEVGELVTESYCILAPKKLVALLDRPELPG